MDARIPRRYRFDRFELDADRRLLRTDDGERIELSTRAFDVLCVLVDRGGQDVSREALFEAVWPRTVVEDNNLDQAISSVRRALGDSRTQPRYILTIPGRGYRFVGELVPNETVPPIAAPASTAAAMSTPAPRRWRASGLRVAVIGLGLLLAVVALVLGLRTRGLAPQGADRTATDAYQAYSAGLYHWQRREPGSHAMAVSEFERAVALDPGFAEAWAALSGALAATVVFNDKPAAVALPRALDAARRAVALDPRSGAARGALGHALVLGRRDHAAGERHYAAALALQPGLAQVRMWRAINLANLARLDEALVEIRRAQQDDPRSMAIAANLGLLLHLARRHEAAAAHLRRLLAVEPRSVQTRVYLARAELALGDPATAMSRLGPETDRAPFGGATRGRVLAALGRRDEAQGLADAMIARATQGFATAYDAATIEAALGTLDAACEGLRRAQADGSPGFGLLLVDPALDALREQPCYGEIAAATQDG